MKIVNGDSNPQSMKCCLSSVIQRKRAGLRWLQVEDGSWAANYGIVVGDVIMQFNGKRIEGSDHGKLLSA